MRLITKFVLFAVFLAAVKSHYAFSESNNPLVKNDVERLLNLMRTVTGNTIDIFESYGIPVNSELRMVYNLSSSKTAGNSESQDENQQLNEDIAIIKGYRNSREVLKIEKALRSIDKKMAASYTTLLNAVKQLHQSSDSNFEENANLLKETVMNISSMVKNDLKPVARNQDDKKVARCCDFIKILWDKFSKIFESPKTTTTKSSTADNITRG